MKKNKLVNGFVILSVVMITRFWCVQDNVFAAEITKLNSVATWSNAPFTVVGSGATTIKAETMNTDTLAELIKNSGYKKLGVEFLNKKDNLNSAVIKAVDKEDSIANAVIPKRYSAEISAERENLAKSISYKKYYNGNNISNAKSNNLNHSANSVATENIDKKVGNKVNSSSGKSSVGSSGGGHSSSGKSSGGSSGGGRSSSGRSSGKSNSGKSTVAQSTSTNNTATNVTNLPYANTSRPNTEGHWVHDGKNWTYKYNSDDKTYTGWIVSNSRWYYLNDEGILQSGWQNINGNWYLFHYTDDATLGALEVGWNNFNGKWYNLSTVDDDTMGRMYVDTTTPDGYRVGSDGSWNGETR